jgi:dihydroorotate dehydrogenase electron transfer subunit
MQIVPLLEVVTESHHTTTYRFRADFGGVAGQFVMVWIPRHDELPMALSYLGPVKGITVHAYGDATKAFQEFKPGDRIGVRGPYGNAFRLEGERILAVAGGTGMASIIAAIEAFAQQGAEMTTAVGARTAEELLFLDRAGASGEVHVATDDGSRGFHGFAPSLAEKLIEKHKFDQVIACGPERMMRMVYDVAMERGLKVQVSLERYMKCGIGICDACVLDDRLVCVDGPVFTGEQLAASQDFGKFRRDKSGRRVPI